MDILLKIIYEYRVSKRGKMEHLIVVEEARDIAPARRGGGPAQRRGEDDLRVSGSSGRPSSSWPSSRLRWPWRRSRTLG